MNGFLSMQAEFGMVAAIVVMLLADLILKRPNHKPLQALAVVLTLALTVLCLTEPAGEAFGGMYVNTSIASAVKAILTAGTLLVFTLAGRWLEREDTSYKAGEFYMLTLSTLFGMYLMVSSGSFLTFYIGLETASIPMACLVALDKWRRHSAEAGAKFILSSMFSSALMLYGVSMLYGTSGTAYFTDAAAMLAGTPLQIAAMVFFFAGLGFKISLVPFHAWTPDTYQGAPTPVTGYLSVVSKGAAAFALTAILMKVFGQMVENWSLLLGIVIVVTITVANLFAVLQKDMKRFMAYSSISQAGYLVLGTLAGSGQGMASLVYYLAVYVVANLAIFGIIGIVEQQTGRTDRDAYNDDAGIVLFGRYPSVCRILLEVLRVRFCLPCRTLAGGILGFGEHHHLALLLFAHRESDVHYADRFARAGIQISGTGPYGTCHLSGGYPCAWYL